MSFPSVPGNTPAPSSGHDEQADLRADMDILNQDDGVQSDGDGEETPDLDEGEPPAVEGEEEETPEGEETPEDEEEPEAEEPEPEVEPEGQRHSRPTVQQIKSKYPNFFKEFPDMRHMLFREGEYSRIYPTVEDARESKERADDFGKFSELLNSGKKEDFGEFLKGIKEAGPATLTNMAANFLPSLYSQDREMYFKVTTPIAESMLRNAYKAARQAGNENLANATLHIAQWAFGDPGYATGEKVSEELKPEEKKIDPEFTKEREAFYKERYDEAQTYTQSTSRAKLTAEIRKGLDPGNVFNDFTRNLLVRQVIEEVGASLASDEQHMRMMNSLWKQAHKAGFAGNWKDRILSAYLSRARQLMPAVRTKIRNAALSGEERKALHLEKVADRSASRRDVGGSTGSGSQRTQGGRPPAAHQIDYSKTSDLDILNDRVTLKR